MGSYRFTEVCNMITAVSVIQKGDTLIDTLATDSRRVVHPPTTLFFTLHSVTRNADPFVGELYQRGCRAFVVNENFNAEKHFPEAGFIKVADPLFAMQQLAAAHRNKFSYPVIGITGSNGKTIVKEWLDQLLSNHFRVVKNPKSFNSQSGVPMSVWQMTSEHTLGIFEAGISTTHEMVRLEKMIRPTIGVFTSLGDAHAAGFSSIEEKVQEKLLLFRNAAWVVYNGDDETLHTAITDFQKGNPDCKTFSWGRGVHNTLRLLNAQREERHFRIEMSFQLKTFSFSIPFTDAASLENALCCCATIICLGISPAEITERMHHLRPVKMRLELINGMNDCSIINDSYSADLHSLSAALDFLSQLKHHQKRTIVLSDLLQQSGDKSAIYQKVAQMLKEHGINRFIGIGPELALHAHHFNGIDQTVFFESTEAFLNHPGLLEFQHETILLKGARVFGFERISYQLEEKTHESILEIDLAAMRHNLRFYRNQLKKGVKMMVMVKAFSYGTGSFEVAGLLEREGVDYLAVAYADEGVALRRAGIRLPIMVMNAEESGFEKLLRYKLEPELYSERILIRFIEFLQNRDIQHYPVHIKLDTGMHRLGFEVHQLQSLLSILHNSIELKVASVFSHLSASGNAAFDEFTQQQSSRFLTMAEKIRQTLGYDFIKHIANSSAIVRHAALQMDMVRLGIGLYGVDEDPSIDIHLLPVAKLRTTISQIREVEPGESVGYNRSAMVQQPTSIATVRIGYADGYPRALGNGKGKMLINGKLAPVIGNVCMDMTMLNISGIDAREGDSVVVFGEKPRVQEVAAWADTIAYEMLTGVSQRVKRAYFNE